MESTDGLEITDRENDVLRLLLTGKSNPQIATLLTISKYTVRDHISSLLHKTDTKNRGELISKILTEAENTPYTCRIAIAKNDA